MGKGLRAAGIILACLQVAACGTSTAPRPLDIPDPMVDAVSISAFDGPGVAAAAPEIGLTPPAADPVARSMSLPERLSEPRVWDATPVVATDATALVDQLVTAERAVRDPRVTGDQLAYMGHLQQLVYRQLIERPSLRDPVFAAIPPDLRAAADLNFAASADLWVFGPVRVTKLPAWRIVQPPPIDELLGYYREAEKQFDVPWYYLAAINLVETRMGRIRGDSYAGARGPMQFMPATWAAYGKGDINDPHDAILGAGRYLRAAGAPKNMDKAIWAYNHDNDYVDAVKKYAEVMRADANAYRGFYGWQVYYQIGNGIVHLPVGYPKP
jgi:soluble lytic murein transglycosylase-like protein